MRSRWVLQECYFFKRVGSKCSNDLRFAVMSEERGVKKGHFKGYIINCVARMPPPPPPTPLYIENREGLYYNTLP